MPAAMVSRHGPAGAEMGGIQKADPGARRQALTALVVVAVVGTVGLFALDGWLVGLRQRPPAEARSAVAAALQGTALGNLVVMTAFAAYAWRLGARVRRAGRFPPPGQAVVRDTPVREGASARRRGVLIQAVGGALVVVAVALVFLVFRLVARLA